MAERPFDEARAEAFAGRMVDILNGASITLMTSIGHQVGLFDTMASMAPATSPGIAAAAGLDERYVREWLGTMVTGGIVEHEPINQTYTLPAEHAACLTRASGIDNLAVETQVIPLLALVEDQIVSCFRQGGGVPYAEYPRFQRVMAESSAVVHDAALVDAILPLVPDLPARLTAGIEVADVGCGSGRAINLMARAFPASQFIGYDFSDEGVRVGRENAARMGLSNARFEACDVSDLGSHQRFDLVTAFDAIHDQAKPAQVLAGISKALRPDGVFLMVDIGASSHVHENIDFPMAPYMYTTSCMHCMTVSLALGGAGLGAMWGEQTALTMLDDAGFGRVVVKRLEGDLFNNYYIAAKV